MKSCAKQTSCQPLFLAFAATLWLLAVAAADAASYSATVLADQPAVYYRLEDPVGSPVITNAADPYGYQATVLPDGYAAWPKFERPGIGSNSVSFHLYTPEGGTAQESHIELPYAPELNTAGPFTAECWVRPTSWGTGPNDWRCPVGNFGGWGDASGWHFYQSPAVGGASS